MDGLALSSPISQLDLLREARRRILFCPSREWAIVFILFIYRIRQNPLLSIAASYGLSSWCPLLLTCHAYQNPCRAGLGAFASYADADNPHRLPASTILARNLFATSHGRASLNSFSSSPTRWHALRQTAHMFRAW